MSVKKKIGIYVELSILTILLLVFVFGYGGVEDRLYEVWPDQVVKIGHFDLPTLFFEFLIVAMLSVVISCIIGVLVGIFCYTEIGREFKIIVDNIAVIIQTIPIMALLMFSIVLMGLGMKAAVFSLVLQSMLPIIFATLAGLGSIPDSHIDVAKGLGMSEIQILTKIKIPMALPVILSGIRTSTVICISAATLAFSTGAGGLGLLIQTGVATYNTLLIFEGTVPICLFAILIDRFIMYMENSIKWLK